ncbi:hypothetical protein LTR05_002265 [Lithohypha guttulata]|uniref:glutathione-specific gamma-glutamylcyclotransferase n=1 Tax=Lithohypha guttulata TaxID=1690604 RepID=A0AAN7YIR0_9EURO|nr:hypothetical protein LTR05_002265 [Lithohypha guttulata]
MDHDFWLFGYGSLIWKPPPHFVDRRVSGYVEGYVRRFWQHQSEAEDYVWGAAYHIIPSKVKEVQEYLDIREINGYSIQHTPFHPADRTQPDIECMVYIGMPDNPQFLGALDPHDVASKIHESRGPSGENQEYLFNLETALLQLSPDSKDLHVSDLARRVRAMTPMQVPPAYHQVEMQGMHKVTSTEEQEEIEKED